MSRRLYKQKKPGSRRLAVFATLLLCGVSEAAPNWVRQPDCSLLSAEHVIHDGYQNVSVQLQIADARLTVISESNIDSSKPAQLLVDSRNLTITPRVVKETNLTFNDNIQQIIDSFIAGNHAEIRLHFWPTWPETGEKTARFSLIGFTRAYRSNDKCT